ncbi:MAG: hypothetical protein F6K54_04510 [Okeania sp. SIO3B5]|uniref:hypothetical protein n=1 Tax=Okeania sp. SIO3B5 TaxID=2607811 RepID=UPI0013FF9FBD|nr:hypothetical protein [Okeania sp. SIO3B5]NEO52404.1 hypothetical protein [Okeania sp. SIO3B5]
MDWQTVLNSIDELVFQQTGKHLNNLQIAILKGVLNGHKYTEIAQMYGCTKGHAKDEGYELWQLLSEVFGEKLNKSNFCATVERLGFANYQSPLIGNHVRVDSINLCNNSTVSELENSNAANTKSEYKKTTSCQSTIENVLYTNKLNTVSKLIKLGLTAEQIAEAVDLPLNEVQQLME